MEAVRSGVWGVGVWGEKHARVYSSVPEASFVGVYDLDAARARAVVAQYGGRAFESPEALLRECEAISVATPTVAHRLATETALAAGCHVLVEKPMAVTVVEADAMMAAAVRAGRTLQVGQVERFNPALLAAVPFVRSPKFIEGHRLAAFQPRSLDIDVVGDLMIHDIDAVLYLTGQTPSQISAVGVAVLSSNEDIANARLEFPDGCVANLTASRVSVERLRRIRFFQDNAYVSVDLFDKSGEAFVIKDPRSFRPGKVDPLALLAGIQRTRLEVPAGEPLTFELQAFLRSLRGEGEGAASAQAGRNALFVAEEVREAMRRRALQWSASLKAAAPGRERRVLMVAGEASGDHHAANLVTALRRLEPCDIRGVAGPRMRLAGVRALVQQEELAVIGFSGVLAKLPLLLRTRAKLLAEARTFRPEAVVLVDYPGFNLRLGPQLKQLGVRVFYYVAPQVWAWHAERAAEMAAWVDRLAVVFPFEEALFRAAGVPTTFVGHPLLDDLAPEVDEPALRAELAVGPDTALVGLLPGSRKGELARHLDGMLGAAALLRAAHPTAVPVLALAEGLSLERLAPERLAGIRVVRGRTRAVQCFATCCAVASGTATLETALFGTPLVVVYRVSALNWAIARRLVRLPHIGLPNIVAGSEVAPELLQGEFTAERLAALLGEWLSHPEQLAERRAALAVVRAGLGGPGASARAAAALLELIA